MKNKVPSVEDPAHPASVMNATKAQHPQHWGRFASVHRLSRVGVSNYMTRNKCTHMHIFTKTLCICAIRCALALRLGQLHDTQQMHAHVHIYKDTRHWRNPTSFITLMQLFAILVMLLLSLTLFAILVMLAALATLGILDACRRYLSFRRLSRLSSSIRLWWL